MKHTIEIVSEGGKKQFQQHTLAYVGWLMPHFHKSDYFGPSNQVCLQDYEDVSPAAFLLVGRISNRCAAAEVRYNLETINGCDCVSYEGTIQYAIMCKLNAKKFYRPSDWVWF